MFFYLGLSRSKITSIDPIKSCHKMINDNNMLFTKLYQFSVSTNLTFASRSRSLYFSGKIIIFWKHTCYLWSFHFPTGAVKSNKHSHQACHYYRHFYQGYFEAEFWMTCQCLFGNPSFDYYTIIVTNITKYIFIQVKL